MNEQDNDGISVPEFARIVGIAATTVTRYIDRGILTPLAVQRYPEGIRRFTLSRKLAEHIRDNGQEGWNHAKTKDSVHSSASAKELV